MENTKATKATTKAPAKARRTTKATATKAKAPARSTKAPAKATKATTKAKAPAKATPAIDTPHPGVQWAKTLADKGLSQTKAAHAMGVAPMTLNRLINGQGIPTAKVCVLFAEATGQNVRDVWLAVADYELALAEAAHAATKTEGK